MNDRLIAAFRLLLALYLAFTLMMPPSEGAKLSVPITADTGDDGYAAVFRWLDTSGVKTRSFRLPWTHLENQDALSASGNILLTTAPHLREPSPEAIDAMRDWLDTGNTLVIAATLNDTPAWSMVRPGNPILTVTSMTTITLEAVTDDEGEAVVEDGEESGVLIDIDPVHDHPLMDGVSRLQHVTVEATQFWKPVAGEPAIPLMKAAVDHDTGAPVIWERRFGDGSVIVIGSGTLFSNRMLGIADNAKLIENLIAYRLGPEGTWLFDDRYQGLIEDYDPDALFDDSRFWYSVLFLLIGWFIYMLGGTDRLAPPRDRPEPPRQIDFVRAIGGLMARKLKPGEAAAQLLEQWALELGLSGRDPEHNDLWARLQASPTLTAERLESLRSEYIRMRNGTEKSLVHFFNLLLTARKPTG